MLFGLDIDASAPLRYYRYERTISPCIPALLIHQGAFSSFARILMVCPQQIKKFLLLLWALAVVLGCVRNHLVSEACCRTALKSIFSRIELKLRINSRRDVKLPKTLIKNYGTKHGTVLRWIPTPKYQNIQRSPSHIRIPNKKERNINWNINWNVYVGFYPDLKRNTIFSLEQPRNQTRISLCFWSLGKRICLQGPLLNSQHAI